MGRLSCFLALQLTLALCQAVAISAISKEAKLAQQLGITAYESVEFVTRAYDERIKPTEKILSFQAAAPHDEERSHPSHMLLSWHSHGKFFDVELHKNHDLLPPKYVEVRGDQRRYRSEVYNCYYTGKVRNAEKSRVAVSTCNGVYGYVEAHGDVFLINPVDKDHARSALLKIHDTHHHGPAGIGATHLVYRAADTPNAGRTFSCGVDNRDVQDSIREQKEANPDDPEVDHLYRSFVSGKTSLSGFEDDTSGMNTIPQLPRHFETMAASGSNKVLELLVVNDFARFDRYQTDTESKSLTEVNFLVPYYTESTFLTSGVINVNLIAQITWIQASSNIGKTAYSGNAAEISVSTYLQNFRTWWNDNSIAVSAGGAGEYAYPNAATRADHAALFSGENFQQTVVGFAYTSVTCSSSAVSINQVGISEETTDLFDSATIAHEIGHNLGMCHDPPADRSSSVCESDLSSVNTGSDCSGFIMSASSSVSSPADRFSACSNLDVLKQQSGSGDACLAPPAVLRTYGNTSICGNGFIEGNETCDCGPYSDCSAAPEPFTDPCCQAGTCQILPNAQCSLHNACCEQNSNNLCVITPASEGKVCRAAGASSIASGSCDTKEVCDGTSKFCPEDEYKGDGKTCPPDVLGDAAAWLSENWESIVVGGVILIMLFVVYKLVCWCWECMCGDDEEELQSDGRVMKRQPSRLQRVSTGLRAQYHQKRVAAARARGIELGAVGGGGGGGGNARAAVGGVPLPAHWKVAYTREGVPIYVNTRTGERYDFRAGPPSQQPQGGQGQRHHHHQAPSPPQHQQQYHHMQQRQQHF